MARLTDEQINIIAQELRQNPDKLAEVQKQLSASTTPTAPSQPQVGGLLGGVQQSLRMLPSIMQDRAPSAAELGQTTGTSLTPEQQLQMYRAKQEIQREYETPKPTTEQELDTYRQKAKIRAEYETPSMTDIKAEMEIKDMQRKKELAKENAIQSAQDTLDTIAEVEKGIGYFGLLGDIPSVGGTTRKTWEVNVNKLLSSRIIDLMTSMKEASKTGATGFGQLSEKELRVLQDASTALKKSISPKDAQKILNDMKSKLSKVVLESEGIAQEVDNDPLGIRGE